MTEYPAWWVPGKHEDPTHYVGQPLRFIDQDGNQFWVPLRGWQLLEPEPEPYTPKPIPATVRLWVAMQPWFIGFLGLLAVLVLFAVALFGVMVLGELLTGG